MFKHEIVAALGKIMELCGYDEESNRKARKNLKNTATLSEFQQLLSGQIAELCKCNIKRKPSVDVLEKTKQYIDEHYSDTELSLTTIGNAVGMQGNHLSRIFKERYGIAMLDYVTGVRISQAKRLIQENGCSVQEAAEKTVFIRTFKKKEGITPGKYKEMVEKERYEKKNESKGVMR